MYMYNRETYFHMENFMIVYLTIAFYCHLYFRFVWVLSHYLSHLFEFFSSTEHIKRNGVRTI